MTSNTRNACVRPVTLIQFFALIQPPPQYEYNNGFALEMHWTFVSAHFDDKNLGQQKINLYLVLNKRLRHYIYLPC